MSENPYQAPAVEGGRRRIIFCQGCGNEAPTRYVEFHQNIGALVMRFHKSVRGNLCKSCIHKRFWEFTLMNCVVGWWGLISLVVTPIFIVNNLGRYIMCLGMPPAPPVTGPRRLSDETISRMKPHLDALITRLNASEPLDSIVHDLAQRCGATPGQVFLYVQALIAASKKQQQAP